MFLTAEGAFHVFPSHEPNDGKHVHFSFFGGTCGRCCPTRASLFSLPNSPHLTNPLWSSLPISPDIAFQLVLLRFRRPSSSLPFFRLGSVSQGSRFFVFPSSHFSVVNDAGVICDSLFDRLTFPFPSGLRIKVPFAACFPFFLSPILVSFDYQSASDSSRLAPFL